MSSDLEETCEHELSAEPVCGSADPETIATGFKTYTLEPRGISCNGNNLLVVAPKNDNLKSVREQISGELKREFGDRRIDIYSDMAGEDIPANVLTRSSIFHADDRTTIVGYTGSDFVLDTLLNPEIELPESVKPAMLVRRPGFSIRRFTRGTEYESTSDFFGLVEMANERKAKIGIQGARGTTVYVEPLEFGKVPMIGFLAPIDDNIMGFLSDEVLGRAVGFYPNQYQHLVEEVYTKLEEKAPAEEIDAFRRNEHNSPDALAIRFACSKVLDGDHELDEELFRMVTEPYRNGGTFDLWSERRFGNIAEVSCHQKLPKAEYTPHLMTRGIEGAPRVHYTRKQMVDSANGKGHYTLMFEVVEQGTSSRARGYEPVLRIGKTRPVRIYVLHE